MNAKISKISLISFRKKKMQGFRHHGQNLMEFVKLLVPKSSQKEGILRRQKFPKIWFVGNFLQTTYKKDLSFKHVRIMCFLLMLLKRHVRNTCYLNNRCFSYAK